MSDERPTLTSAVLALAAATGGTVAVAETTALQQGIAIAGVGAVVAVLGFALGHSRSRIGGAVVALLGLGVLAGGAGLGISESLGNEIYVAIVTPGIVALVLLALSLGPLAGSGSRLGAKIGCWLVFSGAVASAGFEIGTVVQILAATVAAAVVWDLGENSISLGKHIGRGGRSFGNETFHAFGTLVVGGAAAGAAYLANTAQIDGGSFEAVALLFVAIVLLIAFLHN